MLEYLLLASEVVWGLRSALGASTVTVRMGGLFFQRMGEDGDDLIIMNNATVHAVAICDGLIIVCTSQGVRRYDEIGERATTCVVVDL